MPGICPVSDVHITVPLADTDVPNSLDNANGKANRPAGERRAEFGAEPSLQASLFRETSG